MAAHVVPVVGRLARAVGLPLVLLGLLLPFLPLLLWSVAGRYPYPALLPTERSSRPVRLLVDPSSEVLTGLVNSTVIALSVALIASLIGLSAGRALGLHSFRGKRLVQFLLLAPVIVPGIAVTLGIQVFSSGTACPTPGEAWCWCTCWPRCRTSRWSCPACTPTSTSGWRTRHGRWGPARCRCCCG
jgi:ABC-type spermidine/putrescine transport system permease subunit II